MFEVLEKLKTVQVEAKRKNQKIASLLVNCKPGITKRLERMKKTLQKLGIQIDFHLPEDEKLFAKGVSSVPLFLLASFLKD